ncbi:DUF4013 domain-containing protein [Natrarchaeobius sp. A-rgal3]|uniref:DUF4013 domain-containing protein n=1 Tax=Natrarchaeobius versutus TaxID=1679078 RepID=UPI00350FAC8E
MSYCRDCDEKFERGTILCPSCGDKLAEHSEPIAATTGGDSTWETNDGANAGWGDSVTPDGKSDGTDRQDPSNPKYHDRGLLEFAFAFPIGKGGKPFLLDTVLLFMSFLLVPLFMSYGYSYRLGRAAARGDDEPPDLEFDDWGGLTKDGVIVALAYVAIMIAASIVPIAAFVGVLVVESPTLALLFVGLGFVAMIVGMYVTGAVLPVLLGTGNLMDTFAGGQFLSFALSPHYLKGFLFVVVCNAVLMMVMSAVAFVLVLTVVGIVLLFPLYYLYAVYVANFAFATYGYVYNEAAQAGAVTPVQPTDSLSLE